ncbi:hypothetical protein BRYFOR_09261 [Marvinbryantia formatexigens DSM 14469]|uniref:Extracellular solute-binding protein n=1 Tax=Marvinbryantia formatexigens DSM 14469 TaxID=478749 RepID=C6LKR4_9FIRM|nr:hypothetical protein [Marvinbryantia formatexigens]EET58801.1 hypothetical protein BRYFOR_09261 [Marvinbryantia formatexigens DSM 14469]UWO24141.1 hypothetical protein NQ534_17170 [Marvinbryantia formatexigens DSM 14469]SDG70193.1 hypothetical protein SAMN05660368_03095 [Marvinbryantia formatexigens]
MNIDDKKTALDDDSLLYQKRDDSLKKKDISNLNRTQKAGYFKDYYLRTVIIVIVVLIIAASLIYTMFFRHQVNVLSVAFINDAWMADADLLTDNLRDYYELTSDDELLDCTNYNLEEYGDQMKLTTLIAAQSIDILVCPQEQFDQYSELGYLADLSELLPADLYAQFEDQIIESSEVETDTDGTTVLQTYPAAPHGIDIADNEVYQAYGGVGEKAILCVVSNTEHTDNVIRFLEYLLSPSSVEEAEAAQAE